MTGLVPESLDLVAALILLAASFVTAFITAAMGIGGGTVMLAVMASLMPAAAIIPVHGVVQLGTNGARAGFHRSHIDWPVFAYFVAGSVVGVAVGGTIVVSLPGDVILGGLALFILYTVWGPSLPRVGSGTSGVVVMGVVSSVLTMFFGATGTFISAMLRQRDYEPRQLVGTHSICMTAQHGFKIVAFGVLGFAFAGWLPLVAAMLLVGLAGTWSGSLVLNRLPKAVFAKSLKLVLTALALNLLAGAFGLYADL